MMKGDVRSTKMKIKQGKGEKRSQSASDRREAERAARRVRKGKKWQGKT